MSGAFDPLRQIAAAWLAARRPAMLVRVLRTQGSVPREAGTRMLVAADAAAGTVGGGQLELQAIAQARSILAGPDSAESARRAHPAAPHDRLVDQHYALGPSLGQCCGGALTLRTQALSAASLADWPDAIPLFNLQLYGAGHVGRAIAALLEGIPCQVQWIDQREAEFPPAPPFLDFGPAPHIERICAEPVEAEVAQAPPGAFYLVLTHNHDLDLAITQTILRRGDFAYLGLIGSATKRARFVHRLEARGFGADALARITCPIGIAGIPGKAPELIALAVVAQLLQVAALATG